VTTRFPELATRRAELMRGGGEAQLARQHERGKLGARERLDRLFDPDSFVEFGVWATNPLIGAAGVSAVPMAARVAHQEAQRVDPDNYLLMHAMGPNVAGVIGTAVAAGALLTLLGS